MANITTITNTDCLKKIQAGEKIRLIDVRTPMEYHLVHAEGAELIPLQDLNDKRCGELRQALANGEKVAVICKSGARATQAAEIFSRHNIPLVGVIDGGTDRWVGDNLPVLRSARQVLPLDRQVRIIIGLSVALFSALALFVNPMFAIGSLFFGLGLTFAGITNWCGLALVVAQMPWNRGLENKGASCSVR
jgi:rhodanese-related sulfurtransferase